MVMDALQLLDFDCWRHVFQKLNAEDLLSCRQVCRLFLQLLDEQEFQRKWKFDLILPLIFEHFKSRDDRGVLSWKDLHSIRLVCRSWRQSIDKYVSDSYYPTDCPRLLTSHYPLVTKFCYPEKMEEFHQKFGGCSGSPFPSNTVFIANARFGERPEGGENAVIGLQTEYITKVANFTERFGRNIRKLQLYFNFAHYYTDYLFFCKLIKRIASHLPDLHTLRVATYNYDGEREDLQALATWMEENALPDLPKLQALEIEGLNKMAENYLVEKCAPRLIRFHGKYDLSKDILQQPQFQLFRNLKKLSIDLEDSMDTLGSLRFLESPLHFLKLYLFHYDIDEANPDMVTWNVDEALRNLQHLPIQHLEINVGANINVAEGDLEIEEYINESIQTLSIHFQHFDFEEFSDISFNFLQALTKLENLELKIETSEGAITHPEDLPEEVKLIEYVMVKAEGDTPYDSNVWEEVPSLKILKVTKGEFVEHFKATYTREEYDIIKRIKEWLPFMNE